MSITGNWMKPRLPADIKVGDVFPLAEPIDRAAWRAAMARRRHATRTSIADPDSTKED